MVGYPDIFSYIYQVEKIRTKFFDILENHVPVDKLVKSLPFQGRDCGFEPRPEYKWGCSSIG